MRIRCAGGRIRRPAAGSMWCGSGGDLPPLLWPVVRQRRRPPSFASARGPSAPSPGGATSRWSVYASVCRRWRGAALALDPPRLTQAAAAGAPRGKGRLGEGGLVLVTSSGPRRRLGPPDRLEVKVEPHCWRVPAAVVGDGPMRHLAGGWPTQLCGYLVQPARRYPSEKAARRCHGYNSRCSGRRCGGAVWRRHVAGSRGRRR